MILHDDLVVDSPTETRKSLVSSSEEAPKALKSRDILNMETQKGAMQTGKPAVALTPSRHESVVNKIPPPDHS